MIYASIFKYGVGVEKHVTGVTGYDWCYISDLGKGQFAAVGEVIGITVSNNSPWIWLEAFVGVMCAYVFMYIIFFTFYFEEHKMMKLICKNKKKRKKYLYMYSPIY